LKCFYRIFQRWVYPMLKDDDDKIVESSAKVRLSDGHEQPQNFSILATCSLFFRFIIDFTSIPWKRSAENLFQTLQPTVNSLLLKSSGYKNWRNFCRTTIDDKCDPNGSTAFQSKKELDWKLCIIIIPLMSKGMKTSSHATPKSVLGYQERRCHKARIWFGWVEK
jgi:hypothetical protein